MIWTRDLVAKHWRCGQFLIAIVGRVYRLTHPAIGGLVLDYPHPDMAKRVAFYLEKGGVSA